MIIKVKKEDFDLNCSNLSQRCFEPLIRNYKVKVSKESNSSTVQVKERFYEELTEGQRALFMFYVYYNHVSKSLIEFYWWSAYFMAQPKNWAALKACFRYFNDESFLLLLEKIEQELKRHNHPITLENFTITRDELNQNKDLQASFESLYVIFESIYPTTIKKVNNLIEKNLQEFIQIEN
ncbi:hypothetical protein FJQ98_11800 [Lysinibacillus agricola]|uniref:Uncharacterized protein n=1 Tax=Lysinibacillus agricola TaxID=2590012 RepID=A0ABX7AXT4_9BACI|nr:MULTISPECIES: hypothetical protein [Lysinibacillus]QQP14621.1 hypothetical protein FJQ98_11800 [Lysinibacillus agricola]